MPTACIAERYPIYQPAMRIVTAISQTNPAQVTTSFAHQYNSGIIVRIDVPHANDMPQINGLELPITVTGATTFTVPVDASVFQAYVNNECCCVVPIGQLNSQLTDAARNVLPYRAT